MESWHAPVVLAALLGCKGGGDTGEGSIDGGGVDAPVTNAIDAGSDRCALPRDPGSCKPAIPRFWFNPATKKCEAFSYGCQGNANNFESFDDCVAACKPTVDDSCAVMRCSADTQCVYSGTSALCAAACSDAGTCVDGALRCGCASSCPGCKDCVRACVP